jgi:hypothetical protein
MEHEKDSSLIKTEKAAWGGAREGAGRPKGATNKISAKALLDEADLILGKPFITSLMEGYRDTILEGDRKHRVVYERLIVDKVASNLFDVELTDSEDTITAKQRAFAEAIAQIAGLKAPN